MTQSPISGGQSRSWRFRPFTSASFSTAFHRRDPAVIADWFATYFFSAGLIGLLLAAIGAWLDKNFALGFRVLGIGLLFAAASGICGWVLGLLFGIPRSLARARPGATSGNAPPNPNPAISGSPQTVQTQTVNQPPPDAQSARASGNNTNLEDISDWLTKTMVGVGLTQLYSVPHALWIYSDRLNQSGFQWFTGGQTACTGNCTGPGQLLALALFLSFSPGGFWLGYIGTRTFLTMWLDIIDRVPFTAEDVAKAADSDALKLNSSGNQFVPASDRVMQADQALLNVPLNDLATAAQAAAWGAAQARAGNLAAALHGLQKAMRLTGGSDPMVREQLAKVYLAQNRPSESAGLISDTRSPLALLQALYEPPPEGFTKAIEIGEQLLQRPDTKGDPNVHSWLAAAYGQQYAYEKPTAAPNRLNVIRDKVIEHVTAALKADPSAKQFLRSLWKPAQGSDENDLAELAQDDPDLQRLLG